MQTAYAADRARLPLHRLGLSKIDDAYEFGAIKPADMPLALAVPFAFALGAANLLWLYATEAGGAAILFSAFGPALILALYLPATANLRHRARSIWGRSVRANTVIAALITAAYLTIGLMLTGYDPLFLVVMLFIAAWNPALHLGLLMEEARAYRRSRHIGEFALWLTDIEDRS